LGYLRQILDQTGSKSSDAAHALDLLLSVGQPAGLRNAEFWGEDYWFSKRWQEQGGSVWIDPDVMFTHAGRKLFSGSLTTGLRA
jgi:hypothetical protein